VQDENHVLWEIHPYTACWMYYDGADWIMGIPPGRERSTVIADSPSGATETPAPYSARLPMKDAASAWGAASSELSPPALPSALGNAPIARLPLHRKYIEGPNRRPWIILGAASALLFACAVLVFFGGQLVVGALVGEPTPTRTRLVQLPTPTAFPTIVRQPTLPMPSATPLPVLAKVIEPRVNVRAGPSLDAQIVSKIQQDNLITLIGVSQDRMWYQVLIAGRAEPAWVFGETLQITSGEPSALPTVN
jgi:Bacterial SH3 domain